ncbi:hypothetical protein GF376_00430 [Candidatus Peregrinibacteria bacterium]|nr:hypothetical protein [Candidatus Peregrinibacteria bacterium]
MQNKKLLSILGITAIAANLGFASIVFGQSTPTQGEVEVECGGTGISISADATLPFQNAEFGEVKNTTIDYTPAVDTDPGGDFVITVTDDRGFDGSVDGTGACGPGGSITLIPDSVAERHFNATQTINNDKISLEDLEVQETDWSSQAPDGGEITTIESEASTGVLESQGNITGNSTPSSTFTWSTDYTGEVVTLANYQEAFGGEFTITFNDDDINLDLDGNEGIDTYTYDLLISL